VFVEELTEDHHREKGSTKPGKNNYQIGVDFEKITV